MGRRAQQRNNRVNAVMGRKSGDCRWGYWAIWGIDKEMLKKKRRVFFYCQIYGSILICLGRICKLSLGSLVGTSGLNPVSWSESQCFHPRNPRYNWKFSEETAEARWKHGVRCPVSPEPSVGSGLLGVFFLHSRALVSACRVPHLTRLHGAGCRAPGAVNPAEPRLCLWRLC